MSFEEDTRLYEFARQAVPPLYLELAAIDRALADHMEKAQDFMLRRRMTLQKVTAMVLERQKIEETARVLCMAAGVKPDSSVPIGEGTDTVPAWTQYVERANEIMREASGGEGSEDLVGAAHVRDKPKPAPVNRAARRGRAAAARRK